MPAFLYNCVGAWHLFGGQSADYVIICQVRFVLTRQIVVSSCMRRHRVWWYGWRW